MSGIGIIETPQSYCAHLYYTRKQMYEWRFYFVITRDLEATNMVVRKHYGQFSTLKATWWPRFEHSKITLDIPQEGLVTKEGWRITALTTPTISREDVDKYIPGRRIPECELIVQWAKEDQRPVRMTHEVDLIGAKPSLNYIHLNLNPAMEETERTPSRPQLKDLVDALYHKVADKWKMIGVRLDIPMGKLAGIAEKFQRDPHICLLDMIETWLKRVNPPPTWVAIIEAVEFLGEEQLGKELREKYLHEIERMLSKPHVSLGGGTERTPSKPQLKDLMNALYHTVADKWKVIGVLLEIPMGKLVAIAEIQRGDPHSCLVKVLETWLERVHPPPTWTAIIEAVEFLGEEKLGIQLREKYSGETSTTQFGAAGGKRMQLEGMIMSDEEAQAIVDQALKSGSIKQRNTVAIIVGIVGSGKTWLIHRLFRISPPARYTSTGVAEKSFRGLMHRIANMDSWKLLSQEDILEFLAPLLKAGLTKADIVSLAKTFTEVGAPQPSAEAFIEIEELQPDADDIPSPTHSHAAVAQSEKSYASQAMTRLVKTVKGPNEAFVVEFLHMIDTGGQPEFIEIMPSLIHNSNFTLLVLNLAQSLDEYPPIDYHEDGTAFKRPLPSVLTNRQVIHQFARTLQAKRPTHTVTSQHSTFKVIGTHRDCVKGKLTETLAAVNKELKSIFLPAMEDELIMYRSNDEIIFPVNLLEPDDNDKIVLEQIRQKISDAHIVEEAEVPRVPFSFFMFEQNAIKYAEQKKAKDRQVMVLSFDECVQIGTELKMSSEVVRAALIYFHRHNIFLYFQDVLPNLVFLAPQVPLDFVNAIVAFSYKVKSGAFPALKAKYVRFCNEGIITEEMLCDKRLQFSDCFVPGIYEPQHAIKLFRHIYTIAEEPLVESQQLYTHSSGREQTSSTGKREYLMMSLLDDKEDIEHYLPSPSKVAPLVIHFSNGCVPNGCFGNITSCLISKYNWKVCRTEDDKPECLAHNIVTLHVPKLSKATIVNCTRHLEIYVNMSEVKEKDFNEICSHIHSTVFSAIGKVFKLMRFEDIYVEPAFHCPCKHSPKPHIAKICNISTGSSYLVCTKTSETSQVQREHQFWLYRGKEGILPPKPELKDLMHLQVTDWYRLGLALCLNSYDLDIIKRDHPGDTKSQTCKMFDLWLRTQSGASHEHLIKSLCEVGDQRLADFLCNKYGRYRAESSPKDSSTRRSPSYNSPEQPKQHSSSSGWNSPSPSSHKGHHIPRGWRSRSPEGGKHSRSLSSPKGRIKSRLHKERSKSPHYSRRRSKSQSPSRKRSRSRSPRPSSSSKSPRRSRYQSTRQRSHYRFLASRSRSHSHSPLRTKTRSRSQSPHKQKLKHRSARRSTPQSPSRKWSRSRSPRHNSSSRHHSRSQSPKLRSSRSHSWSPWERYCSGSPTSRNTSPSHSPKRSKSRSHSSRKQRSKSSSPRRRSTSRSPRHHSSSRHHYRSRSPKPHRSPTSRSTSHSRSSKRRTESRSHKQRSKLSSSRRSRSQSPPRRRSRSHSPSSNGHQSRPHSPRSRRHRRQSHSGSPRRRSHSRSPTSRSTFHSHSSQRRRSKSRSLSPHKQRVKSHSTRRRSRSQSPSRKRLSSRSPRHCSSSRHQSRPQSPKSHRRDRSQSHSWSPRQRSHSRSSTSRSKFRSHRSKRRRSMSRSRSPPRKKLSMRSHSPGYSSSSRYRSRSHSPRSRRRPHFWSPHRRSRSRSRTSRNSSRSQRPKRRSKPRSQSPHNH